MRGRMRGLLAALLMVSLAALPLGACSRVVNPATGESQYTTLSPSQERQIGAQQHPQILQEFGGAYDDAALQAYVEDIGGRLGALSDLPEDEFTFTILNSDVVNAFALPGGYVYVSRGLLALAENEAELAGVLGHEIGHVTARHAAQRQTQATGAGILATLGTIGAAILGGQVAGELAQQAAGAGAQAYVAGYSRDQELEADTLGIRYMVRAGYDPQAMASFLRKLDEQSALERRLQGGEDDDPGTSWFATHPRTLDRVQRAIEEAGAPAGDGRLERDAYLAQIDGLIYGEDPSEGFVRGRDFVHPDLGFAFAAPSGFRLQNTPSAVLGRDSQGRVMIFSGANLEGGSLESYVADRGLRQVASILKADVSQPRNVRSFTVGGLPASSSATIANSQTRASVGLAAVQAGDRAYQFIFISPGGMDAAEGAAYQSAVESFRRLSPDEAAASTPLRIRIVRLDQGASVEGLGQRMDVDAAPAELFEILNAGAVAQGLPSGEEVKLVTR